MLVAIRRLGVVVALVLASTWVSAGPAAAFTRTSHSPANGASVNSVPDVRVVHDTPVNPVGSTIQVRNGLGNLVAGTTSVATTLVPNDTFVFTPTSTLTEAGSDYSVYAHTVGVDTGTVDTTFTFAVDTSAPPAPIITELTDPVNAGNQTAVRVEGTAEADSTVTVFISDGVDDSSTQVTADGGAYSADLDTTALANGTLTVTVTAFDEATNRSPDGTATIVKDSFVPTATSISIDDDPITGGPTGNQGSVTISGTAAEVGLTIDVSADDDARPSTPAVKGSATTGGGGVWTLDLNLTSLRQGEITATATAKDAAGNVSPASSDTAIKELGAPVLVQHSPADGSTVMPPATVSATYDESLDTVTSSITVKDDTNLAVAGAVSFVDNDETIVFTPSGPLSEAGNPYSVTVTAEDTVGNAENPATTFTFTVDATAPVKPTITDTDSAVRPSNETTFAVAGDAETGSTVEVTVTDQADDSVSGTTTANSPWDLTLDVSSLLDGTLTVTATATDGAGNVSAVSDPVEVLKFDTERLFLNKIQNVFGTYTPLVGDFDGDGKGDVFWYRPGEGSDPVWLSDGGGDFTKSALNVRGIYTPLLGDYNDDGLEDIFWYRPGTGSDSLWFSDGDGTFTSAPQAVDGIFTPLVGDFNGDFFDDIFWYRPGAADDPLWLSNGDGTFEPESWQVQGTYTPLVGDFNGDGIEDIFWYRPGTGSDTIWYGIPEGFAASSHPVSGVYTPILGDFDGSGTTDIFWYRPGTGSDTLWRFNTDDTFVAASRTVNGFYTPIAGDFDSSGTTDIFWYRPGGQNDDPVWMSNGDGTFASKLASVSGTYTPLILDHDGDGDTDIFWYRPGGSFDDPLWLALDG